MLKWFILLRKIIFFNGTIWHIWGEFINARCQEKVVLFLAYSVQSRECCNFSPSSEKPARLPYSNCLLSMASPSRATHIGGSTLSRKQRIFLRNASECIREQVSWPVNFRRRFNPPPSGNFRKHLTNLHSEISKKSREEIKIFSIGFNPLTSWYWGSGSNLYTIAPYINCQKYSHPDINFE